MSTLLKVRGNARDVARVMRELGCGQERAIAHLEALRKLRERLHPLDNRKPPAM